MTVVSVPYLSMQPELAAGYDARTSLNTYRNIGSLLGFGGGILFRPVAGALGGGPEGYALAGIGYGVAIALPWLAVVAVSWERPDYQRQPVHLSVREAVSIVSRQKTFQRLIGLYLTGRVAIDLAGATLILYFTHVMHRSEDFEPVMLLLLASVLISLPFWLHISKRTEKSTLAIIGAAWWAACSLILLFAQPEWPRLLLFVFPVVTGIGYAAIDLMPWAMVGEVVDEDELESGQRQEGLYYGVFAFLRKLTGTIAVWVALTLLGVLGLSPGEPANDVTVTAIRLLASLGPIAALLLSIQFARAYPLTRQRHGEILEQLATRSRS
jgi:GPH family glycoside/pentoside/hexuronide:cation symporter